MKKLLVAIISTVVMAVGVIAGSAATASAAEGYPGQYAVGSRLTPDPISNVGKAGTGKGFTIFYAGEPGVRVNGEVFITIRRYGTGNVVAKQYDYSGTTRYYVTPHFPAGIKANYKVTVTFQPSDEQFRPAVRSWNVWVTESGVA